MHYQYFKYSPIKWGYGPVQVIFECMAVCLSDADKLLQKAMGVVAQSVNNIGCKISQEQI
jgi:hypothetical protein